MLGVDEYIVNLLAAFVHLRIFEFGVDDLYPIEDAHPLIMEASDRVPHLEYFSIPHFGLYYKRVGGKLVECDWAEYPI